MNKSCFSVQVRNLKWKIKEAFAAASWQCSEPVRHEEDNGAKCCLVGSVPSWTAKAHVSWTWFCPTHIGLSCPGQHAFSDTDIKRVHFGGV